MHSWGPKGKTGLTRTIGSTWTILRCTTRTTLQLTTNLKEEKRLALLSIIPLMRIKNSCLECLFPVESSLRLETMREDWFRTIWLAFRRVSRIRVSKTALLIWECLWKDTVGTIFLLERQLKSHRLKRTVLKELVTFWIEPNGKKLRRKTAVLEAVNWVWEETGRLKFSINLLKERLDSQGETGVSSFSSDWVLMWRPNTFSTILARALTVSSSSSFTSLCTTIQ